MNEAQFFAEKTQRELSLNLAGVILNRSMAHARDWSIPDSKDPELTLLMKALMPMALREQAAMEMHVSLAQELSALSGEGWLKAMPNLGPEASTLDGLALLAECVNAAEGMTLSAGTGAP